MWATPNPNQLATQLTCRQPCPVAHVARLGSGRAPDTSHRCSVPSSAPPSSRSPRDPYAGGWQRQWCYHPIQICGCESERGRRVGGVDVHPTSRNCSAFSSDRTPVRRSFRGLAASWQREGARMHSAAPLSTLRAPAVCGPHEDNHSELQTDSTGLCRPNVTDCSPERETVPGSAPTCRPGRCARVGDGSPAFRSPLHLWGLTHMLDLSPHLETPTGD